MRRGILGAVFVLIVLFSLGVYAIVVPSSGHSSEDVLIQIGEYSMTLQEGIDNNFLVGTCENPVADLTISLIDSFHEANEVFISVNGVDMDLQTAIDGDGLCSLVSGSYSSEIIFGQNGEEIGLEINGTEKTLQEAINDGDFCCEETEPDFYYDCYCLSVYHTDQAKFYALEYNKSNINTIPINPIIDITNLLLYKVKISINPLQPLEDYFYKGQVLYKEWFDSQTGDAISRCEAYMAAESNCRIEHTCYAKETRDIIPCSYP